MHLYINKKTVTQYILIYMLIIWQDAGITYVIGNQLTRYIILGFCAFIIFLNRRCRSRNLFLFCTILFLNVLFVRFVSGGVGLQYLVTAISGIGIAYTAYNYDKEHFVDRFVKMVVFFAVVSIVCWIATLIIPNIAESLTVFSYSSISSRTYTSATDYISSPITYHGAIFYVIRTGNELSRNNGIFNEPGLYQMVLNTALYFCLFYPEALEIKDKTKKYFALILIVTILTCQSTTGYLSLIAIIICYAITNRGKDGIKIGRYIIVAIAILAADMIINSGDSLISQVIGSKVSISLQGISFTSTGAARSSTVQLVMSLILQKPWGSGFDAVNQMLALAGKTTADGTALFYVMAALGIQIWVILIIFIFVPAYKNRKSFVTFLLVCFMYINTSMGQSDLFYPALLILAFSYNFYISDAGEYQLTG